MPDPAGKIRIGRITGAHGIRGEVLLHSYAEVPEDVADYGPLSDETGKRHFEIKIVRLTPKGIVARLKGVDDRNGAEALRGVDLFIDRERLPEADDDTYYHADLIGLAAVAPDGAAVGTIANVVNYGAGDLLEIRLAGASRTELIPFHDDFVPTIDLPGRRVVVRMPVFDKNDGPEPQGANDATADGEGDETAGEENAKSRQ